MSKDGLQINYAPADKVIEERRRAWIYTFIDRGTCKVVGSVHAFNSDDAIQIFASTHNLRCERVSAKYAIRRSMHTCLDAEPIARKGGDNDLNFYYVVYAQSFRNGRVCILGLGCYVARNMKEVVQTAEFGEFAKLYDDREGKWSIHCQRVSANMDVDDFVSSLESFYNAGSVVYT